jgi:hypothetical protein
MRMARNLAFVCLTATIMVVSRTPAFAATWGTCYLSGPYLVCPYSDLGPGEAVDCYESVSPNYLTVFQIDEYDANGAQVGSVPFSPYPYHGECWYKIKGSGEPGDNGGDGCYETGWGCEYDTDCCTWCSNWVCG